jgi:Ca2+-binding EF-hand superfamily protein
MEFSSQPSAMELQASKRYAKRVVKSQKQIKQLKKVQQKISVRAKEQFHLASNIRNRLVDLDLEAAELRAENDALRDTGRAHAQATATAEFMLSDVAAENAALANHLAELRKRCQTLEKTIDAQHHEIKVKAQTSMLIQMGRQEAQSAVVETKARRQVMQGLKPTLHKPFEEFESSLGINIEMGASLKNAVGLIFSKYDTDGTACIDVEELTEMVFDFQCSFPDLYANTPPVSPRRVARNVIEKLDQDGNGELDKSEFFNWLKTGINMSIADRETFAKNGPLKAQLTSFLSSVERYVIIMQQKEKKTRQVVDAVANIF